MRKVRRGIFETNSSSTHALCIIKGDYPDDTKEKLKLEDSGGFSWEFATYNDIITKFTYLAIVANSMDENQETLKNLLDTLESLGFSFKYTDEYKYWEISEKDSIVAELKENDDYYIDHVGECREWYRDIMEDEDRLKRFLLSDKSFIVTGNDNTDTDI